MIPIVCDGPGPHDPSDGVVGAADRVITGMRCASATCRPSPPPDPRAELLARLDDAVLLDEIRAVVADAIQGGVI